ncbi:MAG: M24 family metallopeptidase, partial [Steroidobacter sp.]
MTMNTSYATHLATQRRYTDEALSAAGFEALAIYAGGLHMQFLDDQPYPFKANPHFKLWSPLPEAADCWIVYQPAKPLKLVFLQPLDYWYKPPETPQDFWTSHFEIEIIREAADAKAHIAGLPRCAFIGEWNEQFADWGFAARNPTELLHRLHYVRAAKTEYELECMRKASTMAARAHRAAEAAFRKGASEYELTQTYIRASGQTENELPYPSIIALNSNTAVLHYQNQERAAPADLR